MKIDLSEVGNGEICFGEFYEPFNVKNKLEFFKNSKEMRVIHHQFIDEKTQSILLNDNTLYSFSFNWSVSKGSLCALLCKKTA